MATRPITDSTRETTVTGRLRLSRDTATVQPLRINTHSSREPSCAPQTADIL
jgi:hypothetical protein